MIYSIISNTTNQYQITNSMGAIMAMTEIGELYNAAAKIDQAIGGYSILSKNDIKNLNHALDLIGTVNTRLADIKTDPETGEIIKS